MPLQTIAGLGYSLDFISKFGGLSAVEAHNIALRDVTYNALVELASKVPGFQVLMCALLHLFEYGWWSSGTKK